jgi:hypothetical protein
MPKAKEVAPTGFDVVCTIGHVEFGDGEDHAYVAAMKLIVEHEAPGMYQFPGECGTVEVYIPGPADLKREAERVSANEQDQAW